MIQSASAPGLGAALLLSALSGNAQAQCGISDLDAGEPVTILADNDFCSNGDVPGLDLGLHCGFYVETDRATDTYVDEDFFIVAVFPGDRLDVSLFFDSSVADLNLYLYDFLAHDLCNDIATNLAESVSTTNHEQLSFTNVGGATVIAVIRINAWLGHNGSSDCNRYNILVERSGEGQGQSYCGAHDQNSVGTGAIMTSIPSATPGLTDFNLCGLPDRPGILFYGNLQTSNSFGCGTRCVGGTVVRLGVSVPNGGVLSRTDLVPAASNVQFWYRDPDNLAVCGSTFNLSNALQLP